jgi:hypothetical protein
MCPSNTLIGMAAAATCLVVLVGKISSTHDRDSVIDCERLVVHASVENIEVCNKADQSRTSPGERIEHPDFDIDMFIQTQQAAVDGLRQCIVHQEPDPDTAVRCLNELHRDEVATDIILDQVTLDIDAVLGPVDQADSHAQCVQPELQAIHAAQITLAGKPVPGRCTER